MFLQTQVGGAGFGVRAGLGLGYRSSQVWEGRAYLSDPLKQPFEDFHQPTVPWDLVKMQVLI